MKPQPATWCIIASDCPACRFAQQAMQSVSALGDVACLGSGGRRPRTTSGLVSDITPVGVSATTESVQSPQSPHSNASASGSQGILVDAHTATGMVAGTSATLISNALSRASCRELATIGMGLVTWA